MGLGREPQCYRGRGAAKQCKTRHDTQPKEMSAFTCGFNRSSPLFQFVSPLPPSAASSSRNYLGRRQIAGTFTWDKSHILDGRPWYIMGRDAFELGGRNLVLWYSSSLESWCVGMLDLSTLNLNEGMESVPDEWDRCELRARDTALLPEWITQPWQMLDDERAFARTRAKNAVLYYGELQVDNVPVRYVDAPSTDAPRSSTRARIAATSDASDATNGMAGARGWGGNNLI